MGRVRRYKKLKACDPCAPKRGRGDDDDKYDLPVVDSDDEGTSRKRRRQEKLWARDALRDDEYVEMLEDKARRRKKLPEIAIQPKHPNESMKAFQHRVRQESRALLRASNVASSATQQRRREFLRKRKQEKKLKRKKKKGVLTHEEAEELLAEQRERELLRRDDVTFGETNDAPPDLRALNLPRLAGKDKAPPAVVREHGGARDGSQRKQKPQKAQKPERTAEWARLREEAQEAYRAMRAKQSSGPRL